MSGASLVAVVLLVLSPMTDGPVLPRSTAFVVLAALLILSEQFPLTIEHRHARDMITLSGVFACAMLLRWNPLVVIGVHTVAYLIEDRRARREWWKAVFNVSQYALSLAAATATIHLFAPDGVPRPIDAHGLGAALAGACAFFLVNDVLAGAAVALVGGERPVVRFLVHDASFQASVNGVMAALAPLVIVASDHTLLLVPLLVLPMVAVYRGALITIQREQRLGHDALTDLANRTLFAEQGDAAIAGARDRGARVAVLVIDVDSFREVNHTLGHAAGDLLLLQIGPRILSTVSADDTVARLGGDAFAVLLADVADRDDALRQGWAICDRIDEPFPLDTFTFDLRVSIGVAVFPEDGATVDDLIRHADVATDMAKAQHSHVEAYDPARDRHNHRRLTLLNELRPGLAAGQLRLHYQPKASMASGDIVGVEALLRWHHPVLGVVHPDEFIRLAEHSGVIRDVTARVLDDAFSQLRQWMDAGVEVPIAVNMSPRALLDPALVEGIARRFAEYNVPHGLLVLELTETDLMTEPERSMAVLLALSDMGVRLSVDDFGTGYSSLAYLKTLPVSEVKIDRSFVTHVATDPSDRIIVQSTIDLARNLGMQVVGEGVETVAAWRTLAWMGCDVAQGFLISRPEPPDVVTSMLYRSRERPAVAELAQLTIASRPGWSTPD